MRLIEDIDLSANQRHIVLFDEFEITITLHYLDTVQRWCMDVEYLGFGVYGVFLAVGVLHIEGKNQPFDFVVEDTSGQGIDPFQLTDFADGRCNLYLVEPDEMRQIRGVNVPV